MRTEVCRGLCESNCCDRPPHAYNYRLHDVFLANLIIAGYTGTRKLAIIGLPQYKPVLRYIVVWVLLFHFILSFIPPTLRAEEEAAARARLEKEKRDLNSLLQETQDDLESEKEGRIKAEKQKRSINEVCA